MAMTPEEMPRLRLFLRDDHEPYRFDNDDIEMMYDVALTFEGTLYLGWMLKASDSADQPISQSVGNTSESWGQPTETFRIAMSQAQYWQGRDKELNGSDWAAGRWMELVPDGETIVTELMDKRNALELYLESLSA